MRQSYHRGRTLKIEYRYTVLHGTSGWVVAPTSTTDRFQNLVRFYISQRSLTASYARHLLAEFSQRKSWSEAGAFIVHI